MNIALSTITTVTVTLLLSLACLGGKAEPPSEFDESAIRTIQDSQTEIPQAFSAAFEAFDSSADPAVKAAKWEEVISVFSGGFLATNWPTPSGGWKLLEFPASGKLSLEDARTQAWQRAFFTKLVAQNEIEAVRLRGAGGLLFYAALEGEQWASILILDIAQRADGNLKRLVYWYVRDFGLDWKRKGELAPGIPAPVWQVDWNAWQQGYNVANALGKAIILRSITMLAVRRNEVATAATINLAALSGTDRELKAIALAFGDPALGSAVTAKWAEIAENASDPQMQALAQEVRANFGITD